MLSERRSVDLEKPEGLCSISPVGLPPGWNGRRRSVTMVVVPAGFQLSIGGKTDPVWLVDNLHPSPAINASVIDLNNRFRMVVNDTESHISIITFMLSPLKDSMVW